MSFFSLVQVERDVLSRGAHREEWRRLSTKGAAYRDHCLVWKLFANSSGCSSSEADRSAGAREFLFRRRDGEHRDVSTGAPEPLSFYVVSREQPQAVPGLLRFTGGPKRYDPSLQRGDRLRFELRANPSTARKREGVDPATGQRRLSVHDDVLMHAKRRAKEGRNNEPARTRSEFQEQAGRMHGAAVEWFTRRAARCGIQVDAEQLFCDGYVQHRLQRAGEQICFSSIDYAGVAQVTDPVLLRSALLEGVGRKRSFGCGLLLVRRLE